MKTTLTHDSAGNYNLERAGFPLMCPFKPAITVMKRNQFHNGIEQEIQHTPCGSHCPHFDLIESDGKTATIVELSCAGFHGKKYNVQMPQAAPEITIIK